MNLKEFSSDHRLDELIPGAMGAIKAMGQSFKTASGTAPKPTAAPAPANQQTQQQPTSGLAGGGMDPAQAAQAAQERAAEKKDVQDQIKAKEQELIDLRKRLAELG